MYYELSQTFGFEAAHTLERSVDAEASRRIHGHSYHAEVTIRGEPGDDGMLLDLGRFRVALARVAESLDHRLLNDVPGLGRPTLESLCRFIAERVDVSGVVAVKVSRATGDSCVVWL